MADALYGNVSLQAQFLAAGAVPAADKTGKALTGFGNAAVVADGGSLTGYSLALDGTGDYVTTPGAAALQLGASDFTIDIRFKTTQNSKTLLDYSDYTNPGGWYIYINSSGYVQWWVSSAVKTGSIAVNNGVYRHVRIVRASGLIYLFVDGVLDGAAVANTTNHNVNITYLGIGATVTNRNSSYDLAGNIDYVRITPGVARSTSAFTPPTLSDLYPAYLLSLADSVLMTGAAYRYAASPAAAADYMTMLAGADGAYGASLTSGVTLSGAADSQLQRIGAATETLQLSAPVAARGLFGGRANDAISMSSAASASMKVYAQVADSLHIFEAQTVAGLIDDALSVWVANVATAAHSRYAHYGFNSFARFGGKHYGCKSDGIYLLDGNADGADPIKWTVTFPESDFGSSNLKRFESVYIGAKATGQIVLKVVQDAAHVYHYNVTPSGNDARAARALLGRGSVGRYWQFELASDTERAELDSIDYSFSILSRRI